MASTPPLSVEEVVKPLSRQSKSDKEKVVRLWDEAYLAAGGDVKSVLSYYLHHSKSGKQNSYAIVESLRKTFGEKMTKQERNLGNLLEGLKNLLAGYQKDEDRVRLLEMLVPIFSYSELCQRGMEVSKEMWERARKNISAPRSPFPIEGAGNQDGVLIAEPQEDDMHHHHEEHQHHAAVNHELHMHQLQHEHMYHHHLEDDQGHIPEEEEEDDVSDGHGLKRNHEGEEINAPHYLVHRGNETHHGEDGTTLELQPAELVEDGRKRRKLH